MEEKWIIKVFAQEIAGEEVIDDATPTAIFMLSASEPSLFK